MVKNPEFPSSSLTVDSLSKVTVQVLSPVAEEVRQNNYCSHTACQIKSKHKIETLRLKCAYLFTFSGAVDRPVVSSFGHLQHPCPQEVFIGAVCRCVTPRAFDQKQEQTKKRDTELHLRTQRDFCPPKDRGKAQQGRLTLQSNRLVSWWP